MDNLPKEYEVNFLRKVKVAEDAYSFFFSRPESFDFLPGQYMNITIDIENLDVRGNVRHFTISSSPTEKDHLSITTKIIQSSFKKALYIMQPETKVKIKGPYGRFTLNEKEDAPHVFLAGGIGITPFRSMIKYVVDKNLKIPITLFTSFSLPEEIIFASLFRNIKTDWFKLYEIITQPEKSKEKWEGLKGRIDTDLLKKSISDIHNSIFYISGPPAMVDALSETVKSLNVPAEQIRVEKFTGY